MYRIHRSDLDLLKEACDEIAAIVNIPLETQECKKIIIRDVNNYTNIINDNDIKFKGCFEIDRDYHKNHSKRIVSLSLANYFINGVSPEETINNYLDTKTINIIKEYDYDNKKPIEYSNHGIFDFCIGSKMTGKNVLHERHYFDLRKINLLIDEDVERYLAFIENSEGIDCLNNYRLQGIVNNRDLLNSYLREKQYVIDTPLSKTNRYIVVNEGIELIKKLPPLEKAFKTNTDKHKEKVDVNQLNIFDDLGLEEIKIIPEERESNLEVSFNCEVLNVISDNTVNNVRNNINYRYYIEECYKIINKIQHEKT